jgi:hypothetical protein
MVEGRIRKAALSAAALATAVLACSTTCTASPAPVYMRAPGWRDVQAGTFSPLDPFHAGFGLGSGVGWVTDKTAQENHVGKSGATLHLDLDADFFDLVTLGASLGTIFLSDDGSYKQMVIDENGTVSEAKSSLGLSVVALSAGLRTPDWCLAANPRLKTGWAALYGFARFGHAWMGGGRSIARCVDCRQEKLATPGGNFIEPGLSLGLKANDSWGFSLVSSYRGYFGGAAAAGEWRIGFMISNW